MSSLPRKPGKNNQVFNTFFTIGLLALLVCLLLFVHGQGMATSPVNDAEMKVALASRRKA